MINKAPRLRPPDPEKLRRFTRAHSPFQPPKFRVWHGLLALFFLALIWGQQKAPGVFADLSSHALGNWEASVLARVTVIWISLYAMLFVRTLHPMGYAAMILTVVGMGFRLGEIRITHEPLTVGASFVLLGLALYAMRIITRQPELSGLEIKKVPS